MQIHHHRRATLCAARFRKAGSIAFGALVAVAVCLLATPCLRAVAQTLQQEIESCQDTRAPELQIRSCTALMRSGRFTGQNLVHLFHFRGTAYGDRKDYDHAIADFTAAIRLDPKDAFGLLSRGIAYLDKKDYDRAISDYSEVIRIKPQDDDALTRRCLARAVTGKKLDQALADCNEALRLRPSNDFTLNSRGLVQLKRGAFDRAIADYTAAIEKDPKAADSLYGRGIAKLRRGDRVGGEADIAAAKAVKADIVEVYAGYGIMIDAPASPVSAPPAQELNSPVAPAVQSELDACTKGGDDIVAVCTRLIASGRFDGKNLVDLYFARAFQYRSDKKYRQAISDFDRAARVAPGNADIVWWRGCTREEMGDRRGARADFTRGRQLGFEVMDKDAPCGL